MSGKVKVKGNMMTAMKLDGLLKQLNSSSSAAAKPTTPESAHVKPSEAASLFKSDAVFAMIGKEMEAKSADERKANVKKVRFITQLHFFYLAFLHLLLFNQSRNSCSSHAPPFRLMLSFNSI